MSAPSAVAVPHNRWLDALVDEATFDFYARWLSPQLRWRRVICKVEKIVPVASDMLAFSLKPNRNWQGFRPGQHLQVYAEINGVRHSRSYSLTNIQSADGQIEFAKIFRTTLPNKNPVCFLFLILHQNPQHNTMKTIKTIKTIISI
jgi:hypothetical protein